MNELDRRKVEDEAGKKDDAFHRFRVMMKW